MHVQLKPEERSQPINPNKNWDTKKKCKSRKKNQEKTDNLPLKNMNQTKSKTMEGQSTTWSSVSSHELEAKEITTAELLQMQAR